MQYLCNILQENMHISDVYVLQSICKSKTSYLEHCRKSYPYIWGSLLVAARMSFSVSITSFFSPRKSGYNSMPLGCVHVLARVPNSQTLCIFDKWQCFSYILGESSPSDFKEALVHNKRIDL